MSTRKPRREPKAVQKLIADAQARQVEAGRVSWLKRILAKDAAMRQNNGGGTRGRHRAE